MHVREVRLQRFKRFTDLTIKDIPQSARLVVVTGPNGSGKSAIFEGFNWYRRSSGGWGISRDPLYFPKTAANGQALGNPDVTIAFHEPDPATQDEKRKSFWIRSAYRHEADFTSNSLQRQDPLKDDPGLEKLSQVEQTVRKNYERLSGLSIQALYDRSNEDKRVGDLRDEQIGSVQSSMRRIFDDLVLRSPGDPLEDGAFFFDKGEATWFHYKNLSAGEKAAFDLILDFKIKTQTLDNTVFCIDEPELHMGPRVQGLLLQVLFEELPDSCQLWIATHSLGMMRQALDLHASNPESVIFLDTSGVDYDQPTVMTPAQPDRKFWHDSLRVALDDMARLVAPDRVVLCEGADPERGFDAACYRTIFAQQFPRTEFLSVGNSNEVKTDQARIGSAIEILSPGTEIARVVDGDEHSPDEVEVLRKSGIRVLSRRNLECFLLDDEILAKLWEVAGRKGDLQDLFDCRDEAVNEAVARARPPDDFKSATGAIQVFARNRLDLRNSGSNTDEFLRTTVAPLVTPETDTYQALCLDVFGS